MAARYLFEMQCALKNVDKLEPACGPNDPYISYYFKMLCNNCGVVSGTQQAAKLGVRDHTFSDGTMCNFTYRCRNCNRRGYTILIEGFGAPITPDCLKQPLVLIKCDGFTPVEPKVNGGFKLHGHEEVVFVDLTPYHCSGKYSDGVVYDVEVKEVSFKLFQQKSKSNDKEEKVVKGKNEGEGRSSSKGKKKKGKDNKKGKKEEEEPLME